MPPPSPRTLNQTSGVRTASPTGPAHTNLWRTLAGACPALVELEPPVNPRAGGRDDDQECGDGATHHVWAARQQAPRMRSGGSRRGLGGDVTELRLRPRTGLGALRAAFTLCYAFAAASLSA
jgi:hypothetical protein